MINILLCDDDERILSFFSKDIVNTIEQNNIRAKIQLATKNPREIIDYANQHTGMNNAYFIDIDLKDNNINGFGLAKQIRELDQFCFIIFVTGSSEMVMNTFRYNIEAFDYLIKPIDISVLKDCLFKLQERYLNSIDVPQYNISNSIKIKSGALEQTYLVNNILYVESSHQKIAYHMEKKVIEIFGTLKNAAEELNKNEELFYKSHGSYLVNIKHIQAVDYKKLTITMSNGDICMMSRAGRDIIREAMEKHQ